MTLARHDPHAKYSSPTTSIGPKTTFKLTPWFTIAKKASPLRTRMPRTPLPLPSDGEADDHRQHGDGQESHVEGLIERVGQTLAHGKGDDQREDCGAHDAGDPSGHGQDWSFDVVPLQHRAWKNDKIPPRNQPSRPTTHRAIRRTEAPCRNGNLTKSGMVPKVKIAPQ